MDSDPNTSVLSSSFLDKTFDSFDRSFDIQRREVDDNSHAAKVQKLSESQKTMFEKVCKVIENQERDGERAEKGRWFVSGAAGTGKSFLINVLADEMTRLYEKSIFEDQPPVIIAAYMKAAAISARGQTIYTLLSIPVCEFWITSFLLQIVFQTDNSFSPLTEDQLVKMREAFSNIRLLIIDKISMVPNELLAKVHARLCEIRRRTDLFGGVNVLLVGDILQLRASTRKCWIFEGFGHFSFKPAKQSKFSDYVPENRNMNPFTFSLLLKSSNFWKTFSSYELRENMRQKDDPAFFELLSRVRTAEHTDQDVQILESRCCPPRSSFMKCFLDLQDRDPTVVALFPTNKEVNDFNVKMVEERCGKLISINPIYMLIKKDEAAEIELKRKSSIKRKFDDPIFESLHLANGARVMLTWNLDPKKLLLKSAAGTLESVVKDSKNIVIGLNIRLV